MKTLYLDCFAGISGDMTVGALIDVGLDPRLLEHELDKLHLPGYRLEVARVDKRGLQATQFKVILTDSGQEHLADHPSEPEHEHDHDTHHHHAHEHEDDAIQPHQHTEIAHEHRSLTDILNLIARSDLSDSVKDRASRIFRRLGEAEAGIHGVPVDEVHFHEVGAVDAIVDIVSSVIGIEQLGIQRIVASPLHLGTGFVRMSHGLYPIPAPATALLTAGVPVYTTEAKGELVTPTGAAIVTTLADSFGPMPAQRILKVGYGAGSKDRDFPNVLRAYLGISDEQPSLAVRAPRDPHPEQHQTPETASGYHTGRAIVIEANIDDMNPQFYEALLDQLLAAGALDVVLLPVQMKKQRPGTLLQVIADPASVDALLQILFRESTTIGARSYEVIRYMLQREVRTVQTTYGAVRVKVARLGNDTVNQAPEYEDCRLLSLQHGVPIKVIYAAALGALES
ncbi:MAG: nickel pincer cofactor biosynthesis protein LarC [Chloroflexi bacterium]|nr:nickel pincer cofactor biosynthesis protein LarC [Chloroflexota bacterium]MCL5274047.1 nickel pincer cofactor biosynthesis protein LarC [Chloroflexota bacterium]